MPSNHTMKKIRPLIIVVYQDTLLFKLLHRCCSHCQAEFIYYFILDHNEILVFATNLLPTPSPIPQSSKQLVDQIAQHTRLSSLSRSALLLCAWMRRGGSSLFSLWQMGGGGCLIFTQKYDTHLDWVCLILQHRGFQLIG